MSLRKTSAARLVELDHDDLDDEPCADVSDPSRADATECQPALSLEDESSRLHQILAVLRGLAHYARHHKNLFAGGVAAAFLVVAAKLSLPWPLRAVADSWTGGSATGLLTLVPEGMNPAIVMGGLFLLLGFVLGFFDMVERVCFARFALSTVNDLRAEAMAIAIAERMPQSGDFVSRFVGDSARVSAGMKNFLVHVGTSVILLFGMTGILFHMAPELGFVFLAATLLNVLVTACVARKIYISALRTRAREGKLANKFLKALNGAATGPDGNDRIAALPSKLRARRKSAKHTHLQGIATWSAHGIFGTAVLVALWIGSNAVAAGELSPGDMVVFMMYALLLQSPTVRLARQGAKCGKIFGSASRLMHIVNSRSRT